MTLTTEEHTKKQVTRVRAASKAAETKVMFEKLSATLSDDAHLRTFKESCDMYRPGVIPRLMARVLIGCGNLVYGVEPSYLKFRALEVIARVPYHSWQAAAHTLLSMFYMNERRALSLAHLSTFARLAEDNETMHVVVISHIAKRECKHHWLTGTFLPLLFAFGYFWAAYWIYMFSRVAALELNYLFEKHSFEQYSWFLAQHGHTLREKSVDSAYLEWYGRTPANQYEFFRSLRNDELIHRNQSVDRIATIKKSA